MPSIHYGQTALHSSTQPTVLIPKKDGAEAITDFRPISLIHSFAKIIAKVLALRLAPHMSSIVSPTQSAFIKRRSIHDNYMAVRNAIRRYHNSKLPTIFLKLDIAKAFDSVRWEYLLTLLNKLGFPSRWQDCTSLHLFDEVSIEWHPKHAYQTWQRASSRRSAVTSIVCHSNGSTAKTA